MLKSKRKQMVTTKRNCKKAAIAACMCSAMMATSIVGNMPQMVNVVQAAPVESGDSETNIPVINLSDLIGYKNGSVDCPANASVDYGKDGVDEYNDIIEIKISESGTYKLTGSNYINDSYVDVKIIVTNGAEVTLLCEDASIKNDRVQCMNSGVYKVYYSETKIYKNGYYQLVSNYVVPFNVASGAKLSLSGKLAVDTVSVPGALFVASLYEGDGQFDADFQHVTYVDNNDENIDENYYLNPSEENPYTVELSSVTINRFNQFCVCEKITDKYKCITNDDAHISELKVTGGETIVCSSDHDGETCTHEVVKLIKEIGTVTSESKEKIAEARNAYDSLTNEQKESLSEDIVKVLTDAEAAVTKSEGNCGEYDYDEGVYNSNATYILEGDGTLKISGSGSIGGKVFGNRSEIKKVVIDSGITGICDQAFIDCVNLESISIPDTVLSIGNEVFAGCVKIDNVVIPCSVKEIGYDVFEACTALSSITVSCKFIFSSLEPSDSTQMTYIHNIPEGETECIEILASGSCGEFYEEWGSNYDEEGSSYTYNAYRDNATYKLKCGGTLIISGTGNIGEEAFKYSSNISKVIIESGITAIDSFAFNYCYDLESVVIPDSVTTFDDDVFSGCSSLKSISLPCSFKDIKFENIPSTAVIDVRHKKGEQSESAETTWVKTKDTHKEYYECCGTIVTEEASHDYGNEGEARYTCSVCEYVDEELKAAAELAEAKEAAKSAIDEELGENALEEAINEAEAAKKAIDEAESIADVETAKNEGLEAVKEGNIEPSQIEGICQMVDPEGRGILIGLDPTTVKKGYSAEILVLDCTLLAENKPAWIYTSGRCGFDENGLWTTVNLQYGYYWTLFRIYDKDGKLVDEKCYGFENI